MSLKARQTMTSNLVTVHSTVDLATAYIKMREENVRHLPVLDEDTNIMGIISDRDFQRAMGPRKKLRSAKEPLFKPGATVADHMSWPVLTVRDSADLSSVVKTMIEQKISAVLVTKDEELVGIITSEDLLVVLDETLQKTGSVTEHLKKLTHNSPMSQIVTLLSKMGP